MSVLKKKWLVKNQSENKSAIEKILELRGLNLEKDLSDFHDPFLFPDMEKACNRIKSAVKNGERIMVFGDYDVDGISGTAILVRVLKNLGANVSYRLPRRLEDGYGLSGKFIDEFVEKEVKLLITVDCGISCTKEIAKAAESGMDVIITDHHTVPKNPPKAFAILHPLLAEKYPFKDLTGAGVALKLAQAIIKDPLVHHELIDLAALGTIADLGPLKDENRLIVKKGLEYIVKTKWIGLKKILDLADAFSREIDTHTIGFRIAPRINAAGRIGDPYLALSLLLQDTENELVDMLGNKLESLNRERQEMTQKAIEEIEERYANQENLPYILIASSPDWHVGVLGLVAGRLAETYFRPAIVLQDFGDTLIASARSPEYFNITEALSKFGEHLITFGGHAQAAGFNIKKENFEAFKKALENYAEKEIKGKDLTPILEIDCELKKDEINFELFENIEKLQPFGVGNKKPLFLIKDLEPQFLGNVGKDKDHMKFAIDLNGQNLSVIAFRMGKHLEEIKKYKKINLACHLEKNVFNGRKTLQLSVIDFSFEK